MLACHAVGVAQKDFLKLDRVVVLWLVPSNTILEQTIERLSDPSDPYRRALDVSVGGPVEVLGIEGALRLSRPTADGQTVVIVATIQSFRVEDTTGRKVYDPGNSNLVDHFADITPQQAASLDLGPDGKPAFSLVNVLRLRRPIVIVDEAHNARTELSFATLGKLAPSCIIEFTATPDRQRFPSNVLRRVSAAELKAAEMIKLPIRVFTRPPGEWAALLAEAVTVREDLEKVALREGQETTEYLRPILLLQARSLAHTKEARAHFEQELRIPAEQVKICTSELDELKDVENIKAASCPVRYVITVQKLREGWDCPFAYVLCSLQETRSATAKQQVAVVADELRESAGLFSVGLRPATPSTAFERQERFVVPLLALKQGDLLEPFERTHILEYPWRLSEKDAALGQSLYSNQRPTGEQGRIDVEASGKVTAERLEEAADEDFIGRLHQQVWAFAGGADWSFDRLVQWLDRHIFTSVEARREITGKESAAFLRQVINGLLASRGLPDIGSLVLDRHRLRDAIEQKINGHRDAARKEAFQAFLLPEAGLTVTDAAAVDFSQQLYEPGWSYEGSLKFKRHFYPPAPGELKASGEEYNCAVFLDGLEEVKFWVRNIARRPGSFALQISTGAFYPDFVCQLVNGRILVVEYKGKPWYQIEQSEEKRAVGAVWEGRSNGRCLFIMPNGPDLEAIRQKIRRR